jgi:hypothetical protein
MNNAGTTTTAPVIETVAFIAEYYLRTVGRIARAYLPRRAS